jgi:hypothetical protein
MVWFGVGGFERFHPNIYHYSVDTKSVMEHSAVSVYGITRDLENDGKVSKADMGMWCLLNL